MSQPRQQPTHGPRIDVQNGIGSVAVLRAYGGQSKPPVLWRGMVTIFFGTDEQFDMEVSLVEGRDGTRFVGWPSREYTDSSGQKKYKSVVWCHNRGLSAATAEAIEAFMSIQHDDRPF